MNNTDTICAISTAPGVGGIAIARISGVHALEIAQRVWAGKRNIAEAQTHTCIVGKVIDTQGQELDQAVACVYRAPHSFTGEDVVELSVHGSRWVQQELIMALIGAGARLAEAGEFSRRAFLSGKMDLAQTEAVADMIASTSRATQRLALSQMRGSFSRHIEEMRSQLLELSALLELELDFSEEDVEFASRQKLTAIATDIRDQASALANGFSTGRAIREGVPVAIVGATNAGKSSILNALINDDRAIVSDIHGTTRDVVEEIITLGDYTLRIRDTAGIRDTSDTIEAMGVERSRQALHEATVILLVIDTSDSTSIAPWDDVMLAIKENPEASLIIAANKYDISQAPVHLPLKEATTICTSVKNGEGIDKLRDAIVNAVKRLTDKGAVGDTLVSNARHYQALRSAADAASRVIAGLQAGVPGDLVAQDVRECISFLGEITGAISTPEILSTIFSRFCIGK